MSEFMVEPGMAQGLIEKRRARLQKRADRPLRRVGEGADPLPDVRMQHLRREAEDLYWNELTWEQITGEEQVPGGPVAELVFPAFLTFIDGLLLQQAPRASTTPPRPHPDAVEEVLVFLADRYIEFSSRLERGADSENVVWARAMTSRLIDLALFRLYDLEQAEREELGTLE